MAERVSLSQIENAIFESSFELEKGFVKEKCPFWICRKQGYKTGGETNFDIDEPTLSFETLKSYIEENSAPNGKTIWHITVQNGQTKNPDLPLYKPSESNGRIKKRELMYTHEADKKAEQSVNAILDSSKWEKLYLEANKENKNLEKQISNLERQIDKLESQIQTAQTKIAELEYDLDNPEEEETDTIAGLPKELVQNAVMGILGLTQKQNSSQPINGIEVEGTENKTEKLKTILQRIKAVDRNYVENLEVLAKFMEQQPQQYFAFLPTMKGLIQ